MSKALCPAGCGQKYISKEHAERHADADHADWRTTKARGWATPNGFVGFAEKVTYEHACKVAKNIQEKYFAKYAVKNAEGGQTQDIENIGKSGIQML